MCHVKCHASYMVRHAYTGVYEDVNEDEKCFSIQSLQSTGLLYLFRIENIIRIKFS